MGIQERARRGPCPDTHAPYPVGVMTSRNHNRHNSGTTTTASNTTQCVWSHILSSASKTSPVLAMTPCHGRRDGPPQSSR